MTDITVKLPDGTTARFPAGTAPDVMKAAIQKRFPPQQPATQPLVTPAVEPMPAPQGMPSGAMAELSALSTPGNGVAPTPEWMAFDKANPEVPAWLQLDHSQPPPASGTTLRGPGRYDGAFMVQDPRLSSGRAVLDSLSNGATFGWGDEIQAAVRAPFSDRTYGDIQGELQDRKELGKELYPDANAFGNVVGGIAAPSMGLGKLIAATPGIVGKTLAGALGGGGLGALYGAGDAAAGERVEGAKGGAVAGALGGGILTGLTSGASSIINALMQRSANRQFIKNTPTADTLMDDATDLYDAGRATGATATGKQTKALANDILAIGRAEAAITPAGRVTNEMSSLNSVFRLLEDYSGKKMTPVEMQSVRTALTDALQSASGNEARIARKMLEQFDGFVAPLVPEFSEAAGKYSLAKGGQSVDEMAKLAEQRSGQFSNSGMENSIRTEAGQLDRKIIKGQERGYTPDEIGLIEAMAAKPGPVAATVNKFAPNGLIPLMASGGAGAAGAAALGLSGPAGLAIAGGLSGAGALTRAGLTAAQKGRLELLNALRRTAEGVAPKGAKVDASIINMIRDALLKGGITGASQ